MKEICKSLWKLKIQGEYCSKFAIELINIFYSTLFTKLGNFSEIVLENVKNVKK